MLKIKNNRQRRKTVQTKTFISLDSSNVKSTRFGLQKFTYLLVNIFYFAVTANHITPNSDRLIYKIDSTNKKQFSNKNSNYKIYLT